jgi:hypothetical protein
MHKKSQKNRWYVNIATAYLLIEVAISQQPDTSSTLVCHSYAPVLFLKHATKLYPSKSQEQ